MDRVGGGWRSSARHKCMCDLGLRWPWSDQASCPWIPHYHGHRQRLRERFQSTGLAGLADYEVVELLLTLAIPRSNVKQPAKALIARFGNLRGILDAPTEELQTVEGVGSVAPVALRIIRAAATLYLQQSAEGAQPARWQRLDAGRLG